MNQKLKDIVSRADREFQKHFERDRREDEAPLLLTKYLYSDEDLQRETVAAMKAAGAEPALIYAYKKTGYLLSDAYLQNYTGAAIAEWDAAVAEFDRIGAEPDEGEEVRLFDSLLVSLAEEFESLVFALGLANDGYFNVDVGSEPGDRTNRILSAREYQALCASRVHRTLRTVMLLEEKHLSEDMLKLARSIYESYLHMVVVQSMPDSLDTLVDAVIGVRRGTHEYKKRKDGGDDKRIIVERLTGREFASQISGYKMAQVSPFVEDLEFFDFFHSTTSQLIHPSVFSLDGYVSSHGLDPIKPHMYEEAVVFSVCVAAMVVDWVPRMSGCPSQVAVDCRTVVRRCKTKLIDILDLLGIWDKRLGARKSELQILKSRCLRLGEEPA